MVKNNIVILVVIIVWFMLFGNLDWVVFCCCFMINLYV